MRPLYSRLVPLAGIAVLAASAPALAHPGGWGRSAWDGPGPGFDMSRDTSHRREPDRSREGQVQVDQFVSDDAAASALGRGAITVASQSGNTDYVGAGDRAVYEAAIVDRLVHAGYDTTQSGGGQLVELEVRRMQLEAAEPRRSPVSGTAAMEVGNRGTAYGLAVNVDLTKPLPPLVSTRLEARIRDRATGKVLWEGRAQLASREGDARWSDQAIAARLAEALFDGFPRTADRIALPGEG